jgi:3-oxoacyl-[acyl-carrier protein] reductase
MKRKAVTDLTNRTALITGSARGIGKAIALRYASLGASIAANFSGDEVNRAKRCAELRKRT